MVKKRGLASNRGLDALLGSIKKEKLIAGTLANTSVSLANDSLANANFDGDLTSPTDLAVDMTAVASLSESDNVADKVSDALTANPSVPLANAKKTKKSTHQPLTTSPSASITPTKSASITNEASNNSEMGLNLLNFDVNRLQRGKYQPRIDLGEEALQELATSIRQHGVMQPIVIRPLIKVGATAEITHEIIAGERRWRAAQIAGLTHIPAIVRPMSDDLAIALALIENIQREDLSVMEQAVALQRFHDEFGMSHAQIADVVGKARTTVSNLLRLNQLHDDVKQALNETKIDMGHARALLALSSEQQPIIAKKIINEQLTVRQTEQLIKDILNPQETPKPQKTLDYERLRLNQQLSESLGAMVKVKGSSTDKGSIEIFFHSAEELQNLLAQLQSQ
ncbi:MULTISPECIES: ParB/RepB/Spo0J family partition protein [unclassified Moraxella]|uniref:ParB/RepB/Spo0J family partition protein n=1 Tax=unclassified Moraxella TaxID=2685852 RepID=UPI003AF6F1FB